MTHYQNFITASFENGIVIIRQSSSILRIILRLYLRIILCLGVRIILHHHTCCWWSWLVLGVGEGGELHQRGVRWRRLVAVSFFFRDGGCNNGVRVVASSPARRSPRVFFCLLVQHAVACLSVRRTRTLLENWLFLRDNPPHAVLAADMLY